MDRIVRTCLAKNPDERWQDATDLVRELRWAAEDEQQQSPGRGVEKRTGVWWRSRRALLAAAVIVLLLMAAGVAVWQRATVAATSRLLVVLPL